MTNYLLLHGSWHGAWCWFKVAPRLRAHGTVCVPNLPGRGRDAAMSQLVTLRRMVRAVAPYLDERTPTTIVVHSRYGVLATALGEAFPAAIRRIIYLASYMLPSGHRASTCFASDTASLLRPHVEVSRAGLWDRLAPAIYVDGLYADCTADDIALAGSLLCREPSLPALAGVTTTPARYGRIARSYIRLTRDRAVSLQLQDRLIEAGKPDRVESIAASHSAYFSRPDELVSTILALDRP